MLVSRLSYTFAAAHHLPPTVPACRGPHGHNYRVAFDVDADQMSDGTAVVGHGERLGAVIVALHGCDLNVALRDWPTAPNLALHLYEVARGLGVPVRRVSVLQDDAHVGVYTP